MSMQDESGVVAPEETAGEHGLHIRLDRKMQPVLKDAAELAYKM